MALASKDKKGEKGEQGQKTESKGPERFAFQGVKGQRAKQKD